MCNKIHDLSELELYSLFTEGAHRMCTFSLGLPLGLLFCVVVCVVLSPGCGVTHSRTVPRIGCVHSVWGTLGADVPWAQYPYT